MEKDNKKHVLRAACALLTALCLVSPNAANANQLTPSTPLSTETNGAVPTGSSGIVSGSTDTSSSTHDTPKTNDNTSTGAVGTAQTPSTPDSAIPSDSTHTSESTSPSDSHAKHKTSDFDGATAADSGSTTIGQDPANAANGKAQVGPQSETSEHPSVGPQATCTPASGHWLGSDHGGPAGDYIDWSLDSTCAMVLSDVYLNHNYNFRSDSDPSPDPEHFVPDDMPWYPYLKQITFLSIRKWKMGPNCTSLRDMFRKMEALQRIDGLELIDCSQITDLWGLFCDDYALYNVQGLSIWDTSHVTTMQGAFARNRAMTYLNLGNWSFSNTTNGLGFFQEDSALYVIRLKSAMSTQFFSGDLDPLNAWKRTFYAEDGSWSGTPHYDGLPSSTSPKWYGTIPGPIGYGAGYDLNGGTGVTIPPLVAGRNFPTQWETPDETLVDATGAHKLGYRATGWNTYQAATTPRWKFGQTVPFSDIVCYFLYVSWTPLPTPVVTNVSADHSATPKTVKISGTVANSGTGVAPLEATDTVTVSATRSDAAAVPSALATINGTIDRTSCTADSCPWSATVPISTFADDDKIGTGVEYTFSAKLSTTKDSSSAQSSASSAMTVDAVAPALKTGSLAFNQNARTVSGTVLTSANATAQTNRTGEKSFTVTVTWPSTSAPASTTLTCSNGTASIDGTVTTSATCPASGSTDGAFTIPIPAGVLFRGNASFSAADSPAASTVTLTGIGPTSANLSTPATLDITAQTVSALPFTGSDSSHSWWRLAIAVAISTALVLVINQKRHKRALLR